MKADKLIDQAIKHHRAGRFKEAETLYNEILQTQPDQIDALHLLGLMAYQSGDYNRAYELVNRAISLCSTHSALYDTLGLTLIRQGHLEEAETNLRTAVSLAPDSAQAHNNLGTALKEQGKIEAAIQSHCQALSINPYYVNAHYNLGNAKRAINDLDGAAECFRKAIEIEPDCADALANLGWVLYTMGKTGKALTILKRALELLPGDAALHCLMGDALQTQGGLKEAITSYQRALYLDGELAQAYYGTGCAHASLEEYAAAVTCYQQVLSIAPEHAGAHHNLGQALFKLGQVDQAIEQFKHTRSLGEIAIIIPGSPSANNRSILDARRSRGETHITSDHTQKMAEQALISGSHPLRIGYISAFFENRNWMKPVWGLINNHNHNQFHIHMFSDTALSGIQNVYKKHPTDRFHDIRGLTNDDVARRIKENKIDILVDLNGYSRMERLPLFDKKPAPIIVAWFNMYATSGLTCFDYIIGDRHVIPTAEEPYYTEEVVRVPGSYLTFEVTYPVPEIVPPPCVYNGIITFGCLASQYKITTEVVQAWSNILHQCPNSRIIIKNATLGKKGNRNFVRNLFGEFGIGEERLELDGPSEHYEFMKKYDEIDIALDTFPYNGGTTTMEALWQGVPVLTFSGDRWASRTSSSILYSGHLSEYVARDLDGYIQRAVDLACSPKTPETLNGLRMNMRPELKKTPVCDPIQFTRHMEDLYKGMLERG